LVSCHTCYDAAVGAVPSEETKQGLNSNEWTIGRMETEIAFILCEIIISEHKGQDLVPMLVNFFIDVTVLDSMSPKKGLKVDVFVSREGRIVNVWNGHKEVVLKDMKLGQYVTSSYILDAANVACVVTGYLKVLAPASTREPLWELLSVLEDRIQHIAWASKDVEVC
jgi:hypothetical protein